MNTRANTQLMPMASPALHIFKIKFKRLTYFCWSINSYIKYISYAQFLTPKTSEYLVPIENDLLLNKQLRMFHTVCPTFQTLKRLFRKKNPNIDNSKNVLNM